MVNSRESLAKIPSINNDANPYIITLDIYKEGYWAYDISNYYKGRVDDNGTPFMVRWFEHGQLKNVQGLRPFIRGTVGQHTVDDQTDPDNPKVVPSPDCSQIDQTGETTDTAPGGIAIYRMVNACFTQEGMFYGEIGLKDSSGLVLSSVDIAFKVLGGRMNMIGARKFYVSEFEKALADFEKQVKKLHDDFNAQTQTALHELEVNYNNIAKNAHDSATAAQREIDAVRVNNNNLADTIQSILNNIKANNIVTRPEYDKLANEIVNRLSQINTKPDYYSNYNDMIAANPNGTQDLCVTADNEHKWLYVNKQWLDLGEFSYADIAPDEKKSFYSDHDNILNNPDLRNNAYGWGMQEGWKVDTSHSVNGSTAYSINLADKPKNNSSFYQDQIPTNGQKTLSCGALVNTSSAVNSLLSINFIDANGTYLANNARAIQLPQDTHDKFSLVKMENIPIPSNAETCAFSAVMADKGSLIVCRPQANFGKKLLPYSLKGIDTTSSSSDNILKNPDLHNDAEDWNYSDNWINDPIHYINNSKAYSLYMGKKDEALYQDNIEVEHMASLSCGAMVITNNADAFLKISFQKENGDDVDDGQTIKLPTNSDYKLLKLENIAIPSEAKTATMAIINNNSTLIIVCRPQANFGKKLLPYSLKDIDTTGSSSDNILKNPDLLDNADGWGMQEGWKVDTSHSVNGSTAYSINLADKPKNNSSFYQDQIPMNGQKTLSCGALVNTSSAVNSLLSINFIDANGTYLANNARAIQLPQDTHGKFSLAKIENVPIPSNAETCAFSAVMTDKGSLIVCHPQVNFGKKLLPYSLKDQVLDNTNSIVEMQHKLPYFVFETDTAKVGDEWITTPFSYHDGNQELNGYAQIAIQGDSSRDYPKKNYKIKIYSDADCQNKIKAKLKPSWSKLSNFNLKANYIDATQSRNLVNANLMANATANTPIKDATVAANLCKTQNFGQMEGFPIEVWFSDNYNGLYSCNTKKIDKVFGMDKDTKGTGVVAVLDNVKASDSQLLKVPMAKLDNVAYDDELHDDPDPELVANWSKWLDFLNNSTDDDFKNNLENYLDINALINIYLFGVMSREYDYYSKSILFLTWNNGKYYYPVAYDLDSNWGQNAGGEIEGNPQDSTWGFSTTTSNKQDGRYISNIGWNKLYERLYKLFKPEIKAQYLKLRGRVWRTDQILNAFKNYMDTIPESALEKDHRLWVQIPDVDKNDYGQLHSVITERCNQMDNWIEQLVPPVQPTGTTTTGAQPTTDKPVTPAQTTDGKSTGTTTTDGK